MKDLSFLVLFYLFGAFQGFFLLTILLIRARNLANVLLSFLLALFSFYLVEQAIYLSGDIASFPHLLFATLPVTFLIGPLFYHFIRFNVLENQRLRWIHIFHLLPFLYETIILWPFYRLSATRKLEIYHQILNATDRSYSLDLFQLGFIIYLGATVWFLIQSYRLLYPGKDHLPSITKKRRLLRWISLIFLGYLGVQVVMVAAMMLGFSFPDGWQHVTLIALITIIHLIGYVCFLNPELIITVEEKEKYANSSLSQEQIMQLKKALIECMEEDQLYLAEKLSPVTLAEKIGVSTFDLSRVLSEGLQTNFYRFINEYRVAHAKKLLRSKSHADAKMIHIAFDSGFGNKTSFLRNFKEITGTTPTSYKSGLAPMSEPIEL